MTALLDRRPLTALAAVLWAVSLGMRLSDLRHAPAGLGAPWVLPWTAGFALLTLGLLAVLVPAWRARGAGVGGGRGFALAVGAQAAGALLMGVAVPCYLDGILLALVAWQAALRLPLPWVVAGMLVQVAVLAAALVASGKAGTGTAATFSHLAFQSLAVLTARVARREALAREHLTRANIELVAARELALARGVEEERLRIARELHDVLGHGLTALGLFLESLTPHVREGAPSASLAHAQRLAGSLLSDVRHVVDAFREEGRQLDEALRALAEGLREPRAHLTLSGPLKDVGEEEAHALLRCVQEAVTNSLRHARARNVWLHVAREGARLEAVVRDDGQGAARLVEGNGLRGMRERLARLGGEVHCASRPGAGFEVRASLPVGQMQP